MCDKPELSKEILQDYLRCEKDLSAVIRGVDLACYLEHHHGFPEDIFANIVEVLKSAMAKESRATGAVVSIITENSSQLTETQHGKFIECVKDLLGSIDNYDVAMDIMSALEKYCRREEALNVLERAHAGVSSKNMKAAIPYGVYLIASEDRGIIYDRAVDILDKMKDSNDKGTMCVARRALNNLDKKMKGL